MQNMLYRKYKSICLYIDIHLLNVSFLIIYEELYKMDDDDTTTIDNTEEQVIDDDTTTIDNTEEQILDDETIEQYSADFRLIEFVKSRFKRLSRIGTIKLIKLILYNVVHIKATELIKKPKSFLHYNKTKFKDGELTLGELKFLRLGLNGVLADIGEDTVNYDKQKHKFKIAEKDGERCFVLNKNSLYEKARKLICDEGGDVLFKYDFDNSDMENDTPQNKETLQRCFIQILSIGVKFDYPIEFVYSCPMCNGRTKKKAYETASTNNNIKCQNIDSYISAEGEPKSRICRQKLSPDNEISLTNDAFYYDICYEDKKNNKQSAGVISFEQYEPGFYECVLFKIKNPKKTELYHIIDIKNLESNIFNLPEKEPNKNYLFTLQKAFDNFIKLQTGFDVHGLFPIKVALIMQTALNYIGEKLMFNAQLVGDASTGKSMILKYYGFLLNNHFNLSTNGLSVSVPALRGTKQTISLMGKEQKIITVGYLGTFKSIHIDEAGENRNLIQNLKTFLLEENYGYDKAGATGVFNKRTTHINISENLDYHHLGQYRGSIRKAYRDSNIEIEGVEQEAWNENWDLHLPVHKYNNPYLRYVINEKRIEFYQKHIWWIDGHEIPLHERFPFYFYLVNKKPDLELLKKIKENTRKNTIKDNLELIKVLKSKNIIDLFKSFMKYKEGSDDVEGFNEVDKILDEYGIITDVRMKEFYYSIVKVSRIVNMRYEINNEDYDLLKWFLEKMNCKIDVVDTVDYDVLGPPDIKGEQEKTAKIEDSVKVTDSQFGLPDGEFE